MEERRNLFNNVIKTLSDYGLLEDLILIGSWVLYIYKRYYKDSGLIPVKRTLDIDFLIKNPPKIKHKVNIDKILCGIGFDVKINRMNNLIKYVHPELEVEFLINQKGRGDQNIMIIKDLSITAVQLRYLNLLEDNVITIDYEGIKVKVPEPAAFTLHKYIVSKRRLNKDKAEKDITTAKDMTDYLLSNEEHRKKLTVIFDNLHKKWQKTIMDILKKEHQELYDFLVKTL